MPTALQLLDAELLGDAGDALNDIMVPPCPEVIVSLMKETLREEVDFIRVSRLVSGDVALAAGVLKTANSPFFGLRRAVHSVHQAVAVLGLGNLLKIVYAFMLRQSLTKDAKLRMNRLWDRAHYNAIVAEQLASRLSGISQDDAYTFGLFHDVGIGLLVQKFDDYKETLSLANASLLDPTSIEDQRYRTNHAIVGAVLARNWYLSEDVVWAVRYHHALTIFDHPSAHATPAVRTMVAMGCVSEHIVANFLGYPDDAEWERARSTAVMHLGISDEEVDALALELAPGLREVQAARV